VKRVKPESCIGCDADGIRSQPSSCNDIMNYLGLTVKIVNRVFTRFQYKKLLRAEGKQIAVLNAEHLYRFAWYPLRSNPLAQ